MRRAQCKREVVIDVPTPKDHPLANLSGCVQTVSRARKEQKEARKRPWKAFRAGMPAGMPFFF